MRRTSCSQACQLMMHWVCCIKQAGMHAVRKNRYVILPKDFEKVCNRLIVD